MSARRWRVMARQKEFTEKTGRIARHLPIIDSVLENQNVALANWFSLGVRTPREPFLALLDPFVGISTLIVHVSRNPRA